MMMNQLGKWVLVGLIGSALPEVASAADKGSSNAAQPSKDASAARSGAKPEEAVVYTCPMHPEVISDKPGRCPKCGMKLERKTSATPEKK